ncbi:MAG: hypothetical protein LWW85_13335, partial [Marinilabiliales bacterium]|nr:hypothetical protein [Marinilabiliales bacterium]
HHHRTAYGFHILCREPILLECGNSYGNKNRNLWGNLFSLTIGTFHQWVKWRHNNHYLNIKYLYCYV